MPLVRLEVRNEFRLGDAKLYEGGKSGKDDSKAILDGVAVAGLVGILRQLGDLTEFAADVFHDLHEQVTATAARGRKISTRIQNIEFALPFVEKAVKGQQSHIHFAYVAGSKWHARLRDEKSHLVPSELPYFMIESYEECHEPPQLYLLDKFDHHGTGACLKRYSDPSYFRRVWAASETEKAEGLQREKVQKIQRKGSQPRIGEVQREAYISCKNSSARFASPSIDGQSFTTEDASVHDAGLDSEISSRTPSFGSRIREQTSDVNNSAVPGGLKDNEVSECEILCNHSNLNTSGSHDNSKGRLGDSSNQGSLNRRSAVRSYSVTWDEITEIVKPRNCVSCDTTLINTVLDSESLQVDSEPQNQNHTKAGAFNQADILLDTGKVQVSLSSANCMDEVSSEAENHADAHNTLEFDAENEVECQTKWEVNPPCDFSSQEMQPGKIRKQDRAAPNPSTVKLPNASQSSLKQDSSSIFMVLKPSGSSGHMPPPQETAESSPNQEYSFGNNIHDNSKGKFDQGNRNGHLPGSDIADSQIMMADKSRPKTSVAFAPSIQLWANGGLFGVEASKPLLLGVMNNSCVDVISGSRNCTSNLPNNILKTRKHINGSLTTSDAIFSFSESILRASKSAQKIDGESPVSSSLVQSNSSVNRFPARSNDLVQLNDSSKYPSSCHRNQQYGKDVKQKSQVPARSLSLGICDMGREDHSIVTNASSNGPVTTKNSAVVDGVPLSGAYNTKSQYHAYSQSTKGISSVFSEPGQRFLANSLETKGSVANTDGSVPSGDKRKSEDISRLNNRMKAPSEAASLAFFGQGIKNQFDGESLKRSTSSTSYLPEQSSPPLEHMKISFQPMNGLETSKMKLKVLNGSLPETSEDTIFPAFQLIQGPVDSSPDNGSESDDDTFCRSYPYSSEDLFSPLTYTNSELWDKDERSECEDHELYDVSPRIPMLNASFSGYTKLEKMNQSMMDMKSGLGHYGVGNTEGTFQDVATLKLPVRGSAISLENQQRRYDSSSDEPTSAQMKTNGHLPPPPPLPPMKWRISKPPITSGGDEAAFFTDNTNYLNGLQAPKSFSPHQQDQSAPRQPCDPELMMPHSNKTQDQQKPNKQKNLREGASNKEVDLWGELLRQIRNKSYNLRSQFTSRAPMRMPMTDN
ncbi:hypothetical protein OPV22_027900 [Ensete ventricosum]|uniref:Protein SCAR n=1 Tax=Ensete ventricosum TaxID=4639 RepID=A0AAV8Q6P2_ENSVE|nr:hypothetical protein OPV22_027900 [Ensete ventricosum]